MQKWEYMVYAEPHGKHSSFVDGLNDLGAEGWELVQIDSVNGHHQAYLKRPVEGR